MEQEEFCDKYCPIAFHSKFRNGDTEIDCDMEAEECPFNKVDFSKVFVNEVSDLYKARELQE